MNLESGVTQERFADIVWANEPVKSVEPDSLVSVNPLERIFWQGIMKRLDHWWKPLGCLLLTVYWFHPLCWIA